MARPVALALAALFAGAACTTPAVRETSVTAPPPTTAPPPATPGCQRCPAWATTARPNIEFDFPKADIAIQQDTIYLIARISAALGVQSVKVFVNGTEIKAQQPAQPGAPITVRIADIPLHVGDNVIDVRATTTYGVEGQARRVVTRLLPGSILQDPPPPSKAPPPPPAGRYAVVIGVGRYDDPTFKATSSANDARAVYEFLTTRGGYRADNVLHVTDPTLASIKLALGEWLYKRLTANDTALIFYSGLVRPERAGVPGGSSYLVPRDAVSDSLFVTGFDADDIQSVLNRQPGREIVWLFDACLNPGWRGPLRANRVVITACASHQDAAELPGERLGLFTSHLLQALSGAADQNGDGVVSARELFEFLHRNVTEHAARLGVVQRPAMTGSMQ